MEKNKILFDSCINELKNYPITFVKVICSLEDLKRREVSRGDRDIGTAEWQVKQGLYQNDCYEVEVDTSEKSLQECAKIIHQQLLEIE